MKRKIALPGEKLCVIEEFAPGENTFVSKDGEVLSATIGFPSYDLKRHLVSVEPLKKVSKPKVGDLVLCEVKEVQEKIVICDIIALDEAELKYRWSGILALTPKRRGGSVEFSIGDLLLAKVVSETYGIYVLSIDDRGLGSVLSFCDSCGRSLTLRGKGLICPNCRITYRRKVVSFYGNRSIILKKFGYQLS